MPDGLTLSACQSIVYIHWLTLILMLKIIHLISDILYMSKYRKIVEEKSFHILYISSKKLL